MAPPLRIALAQASRACGMRPKVQQRTSKAVSSARPTYGCWAVPH